MQYSFAPPRVPRQPSRIRDYLFLGGVGEAGPAEMLAALKITHIINATSEVANIFPDQFTYKQISLSDTTSSRLAPHFRSVMKFVDEARSAGGAALIHCFAGVSRSATLVLAYLMLREQLSLADAFSSVYQVREFIEPNQRFMLELRALERQMFGVQLSLQPLSLTDNPNSPKPDFNTRLVDVAAYAASYSEPEAFAQANALAMHALQAIKPEKRQEALSTGISHIFEVYGNEMQSNQLARDCLAEFVLGVMAAKVVSRTDVDAAFETLLQPEALHDFELDVPCGGQFLREVRDACQC